METNVSNNTTNKNTFFDTINPQDSILFSNLSTPKKKILLNKMKEYLLDARDTLNFKEPLTFGIEIENENTTFRKMKNRLTFFKIKGWNVKHETTLDYGCEIISPILKDDKNSWKQIDKICSIISNNFGEITPNCGGHIHFGADILGNKNVYWQNFILLCAAFENTIYHFSAGEYRNIRLNVENFAKPFYDDYKNAYAKVTKKHINLKEIHDLFKMPKYYGISLQKVKWTNEFQENNTIEFRMPNGTLNSIIWQNNINFFGKLLLYCKDKNFNRRLLLKKLQQNYESSVENFNELNYEDPFILADLIFDNNLDKLYFLRQYFKDEIIVLDNDTDCIVKAKKFTK